MKSRTVINKGEKNGKREERRKGNYGTEGAQV